VETGKVLCIVEAMKLMNEIESDVPPAKLFRIFVSKTVNRLDNTGKPLFGIRPSRQK